MIKVHSYESMGTYDGPGLRLVVFLQGCPFRCLYCANPDTIAFDGGTPTEIDHIVNMAVNQKPFFGKKGGVTFSGGEPTAQAKELLPVIDKLKENGILVRWFDADRIRDYVRITIGSKEQMEALRVLMGSYHG